MHLVIFMYNFNSLAYICVLCRQCRFHQGLQWACLSQVALFLQHSDMHQWVCILTDLK